MPGPMGRGPMPRGMKPTVKNPGKILKRLIKYMVLDNLALWICVCVCIGITVFCMTVKGTLFTRTLVDIYIPGIREGSLTFADLAHEIFVTACFIVTGILASFVQARIMVRITQGFQRKLRDDMFEHMESLPIKYFDTHSHGDIMSIYTNDIDTLRQVISQSLPQILSSGITIVSVFVMMIVLSVPLTFCGGIGGGAQSALSQAGITLYGGVTGSADEAVNRLIAGTLEYDPNVVCNHHHDHGDGGCGHHYHEDGEGCCGHHHDHDEGGCCHD